MAELDVDHDAAGEGGGEEEESDGEQGVEPEVVFGLLHVARPLLAPAMSKVDEQHELHNDVQSSANHANPSPGLDTG